MKLLLQKVRHHVF